MEKHLYYYDVYINPEGHTRSVNRTRLINQFSGESSSGKIIEMGIACPYDVFNQKPDKPVCIYDKISLKRLSSKDVFASFIFVTTNENANKLLLQEAFNRINDEYNKQVKSLNDTVSALLLEII